MTDTTPPSAPHGSGFDDGPARPSERVVGGPLLAFHDQLVGAIGSATPQPLQPPESRDDRISAGPLLAFHDQLVAAIAAHADDPSIDPSIDPAPNPVAELTPRRAREGRDDRTDEHGRRRRRMVRALAAAAVVLAIVAIGVAMPTGSTPRVDADVTITRQGGRVTVVLDDQVSVEALARKLKDAGIDVTVSPLTTGPSRVGRIVGDSGSNTQLTNVSGPGPMRAVFTPASDVELYVGVLGTTTYDSPPNAYDRKECLAGADLDGTTLGTSRAELEQRAAANRVTIEYFDPEDPGATTQPDDGIILTAICKDPRTAVVGVRTPSA